MTVLYEYRKGDQIEKYIGQFMRIFSGFQVKDGVERNGDFLTKRVPVVYGNMSRIVASILTKRDFLANANIPLLAANMVSLSPDLDNKRALYFKEERLVRDIPAQSPYLSLERMVGPAFVMQMELSIYASSTTELFDIVEQILLVFNPRVAIQTSTDIHDADYLTDVSLVSIQPEISYPMGTDQPIVMMTLSFEIPVRLKYPKGYSDKIIEQIISNVKTDEDVHVETATITGDPDTGEITTEYS